MPDLPEATTIQPIAARSENHSQQTVTMPVHRRPRVDRKELNRQHREQMAAIHDRGRHRGQTRASLHPPVRPAFSAAQFNNPDAVLPEEDQSKRTGDESDQLVATPTSARALDVRGVAS